MPRFAQPITVPRFNRGRRRLAFGLLPLACLAATLTAAGATSAAGAAQRSRPAPPPVTLTWSTVSPPAAPPPLAFASAVYDSDSRTVVLFGGLQADGALSNDTWVWNGSTWTDYPGSETQAPPARKMASMAFDPKLHQLILFGGEGAGGQLLSDTWAWNGASWYDETGRFGGPGPGARADAAMAYDGRGDLVLFGGTGTPSPTDPYVPEGSPQPAGSTLVPASPPTSPATSPAPSPTVPSAPTMPSTTAPTVTTSGVESGSTASAPLRRPPGSPAVPAASPAIAVIALTRSPLTGLVTGLAAPPAAAGPAPAMLGDTWLWTANGWVAAPGSGPTARAGAAVTFDPAANVSVLFGGNSAATHPAAAKPTADTWIWNGTAWHQEVPTTSPPGREGAAMAADASIGGVVLFGGSGTSGDLSDAWQWDGKSWEPAHTIGSLPPRVGAATAFDAATGKVLVFGGVGPGGATLDDTVMLSEKAPVALSGGATTASPTSSSSTGPAGMTTQPAGNAAKTGVEEPPSTTSRSGHPGLSPAHPSLSPLHPLHRGDLVTLKGAGFAAGAAVTISFRSQPVEVGKAVTNSLGDFTATVAVPNSATDGLHRFEASGLGRAGPISELIATVRIVGVPDSNQTSSTEQRVVLTVIALLIPGLTWITLVVTGGVRRRRAELR
jgi:hypothetical protein